MQAQQCTGLIYFRQFICIIVSRVSYVNINGTKYSKGGVLLCTFCSDDPLFGRLTDFIVNNNECWFVMQPMIATKFNKHYNAYEVEPQNDYIVCHQQDLVDHHVLCISKSFDRTLTTDFVTLKYHVM